MPVRWRREPAVPLAVGRYGRRRILLIGMADFTTVRPIGSRRAIRTGGIVPSSHGEVPPPALQAGRRRERGRGHTPVNRRPEPGVLLNEEGDW